MPARPRKSTEKLRAAAAVVVYVRCPVEGTLSALPAGVKPKPEDEVGLTLDAN